LADSFIKIGEEFHYVGGSMDELSEALYQSAYQEALWGAKQLELETNIARTASLFNEDKTFEKFDTSKYTSWDKNDKAAYLDAFRDYASGAGVESLSFLTDTSG
jgi:hypothetical protein